ncbi:ATP-binding cassette domain-containing protein [Peribacillus simplex]|nr:ATP-binding cassette domain-containing protein [Peribacillus simplex]
MVATLEINHVSKTFKNENESVHVLDNLNLTVTIIGPSGCGKSTLLKLIAGLDSDFDGAIIAGEHPVSAPSKDRGFIFQEHRLFPWLNVEKNIAGNLPLKKPDIRKGVSTSIIRWNVAACCHCQGIIA